MCAHHDWCGGKRLMQSVLALVLIGEREQEGSQARSHMHQEGCGGGGFEQGRCEKNVERSGVTLGWQKAPSRCPRTTPMRILTVRATLTKHTLRLRVTVVLWAHRGTGQSGTSSAAVLGLSQCNPGLPHSLPQPSGRPPGQSMLCAR